MRNRFAAKIRIDGKNQHLGTFDTAKEGAIAWDFAAIQAKRPKSDLNLPNNMKRERSKRKHNRKHIRVSTYFDGRANHLRTFAKVRDTVTAQKSSNERTTM